MVSIVCYRNGYVPSASLFSLKYLLTKFLAFVLMNANKEPQSAVKADHTITIWFKPNVLMYLLSQPGYIVYLQIAEIKINFLAQMWRFPFWGQMKQLFRS